MNIYEWMRAVSNSSLDYVHNVEALDMINGLERAGAFGTIVRTTEGAHRFTRESPVSDRCGLCHKRQGEHEQ